MHLEKMGEPIRRWKDHLSTVVNILNSNLNVEKSYLTLQDIMIKYYTTDRYAIPHSDNRFYKYQVIKLLTLTP